MPTTPPICGTGWTIRAVYRRTVTQPYGPNSTRIRPGQFVQRENMASDLRKQRAADESGCTPGSVARLPRGGRGDGHPSRAGVAAGLVRSTRGLGRAALERPRRARVTAPLLTLLRVGFTEPPESPQALVVSYTTVSPLPGTEVPGGLLSVALSRGSPRVAVSHHPALWSPDVPREAPPKGTSRGRPPGSSAVSTMVPGPRPALEPEPSGPPSPGTSPAGSA